MTDMVCYVSSEAPKLFLRVEVDGKDYKLQFANKALHLDAETDAGVIAELDRLIETQSNISSLIHKVDMVAAEAMARAHRLQQMQMSGTMTGAVSADQAKRTGQMAIMEREKDLVLQGATEEDLNKMRDEMSKDGLEMTVNSDGVVAAPTRDGFTEDEKPAEEVAEETKPAAEPKAVFANLGTK